MGTAPDPDEGSGASSRSQEWSEQHPEEYSLLRRCWDNDEKYPRNGYPKPVQDPDDAQALSDWVTRTVMNSRVRYAGDWDAWPPRYWHPDPNENAWWERI